MKAEIMQELVSYQGEDRVVHYNDFLLSKATINKKTKSLRSHFLFFDEKMGGLETGEVVVITGHTKNGKTLFAESWCRSMMKLSNAKTMILSFEVQTEKLLTKYIKGEESPLYVPMALKTMDFEWLKARCLEAKLKYDCSVVLIDHLHFLVDMSTKQNMSLNIGAFMRRLKQEIAIGLNMAVILIAHQGQPKENGEASMSGIRDSSFIGQECDAVVIVSRRENLNSAELKEYSARYGEERIQKVMPPALQSDIEDKYSTGLAVVKIACTRRTGVFDCKKMFKKVGEFMEEI